MELLYFPFYHFNIEDEHKLNEILIFSVILM